MVTAIVFAAAGLVLLAVVVAAGTRTLLRGGGGSSVGDALGNFIDVFDPARAQADRDLQSKAHEGEAAPSPDDDDRPVVVDLAGGTATVRVSARRPRRRR